MKRIWVFWLIIFSFAQARAAGIQFYSGSFAQLKQQAAIENRPFFVHFYTGWCEPCDNMETYTFANEGLGSYVEANYLAFNVDAESFANGGLELAETYRVIFYPSILIFSPSGELLHKTTGFKHAADLKVLLQKFRFEGQEAPPASPPVVMTPKSEPPRSQPPIPAPAPGDGLFNISVSTQNAVGYGVQVGVYGEFANVIKQTQTLEASFQKNVLVNINELNGKTVFRLILGPLGTRAQADAYLKTFKEQTGREGLVVDLARFK